MGLFFSSKKIYRDELKKILRGIPGLSEKERAYVNGVFQDSLRDGLSKEELRREIQHLKHNPNDPLEPFEVKKIKEKLMEHFK
jgi:hypothetical protein